MRDYQFEYSINYEGKVIDIGVMECTGNKKNRTLLIIGGLGGKIAGYNNKYVLCATSLLEYVNVISINTPRPFKEYNHLKVGIDAVRKNFPSSDEIYIWGHSAGAYYALRNSSCEDYTEIKRLLLTNMPITVFIYDKIMGNLEAANNCAHLERIEFIYSEFDESYDYREKLIEAGYEKVKVYTAWGQDHDFSFSLRQFINLPRKYMLHDVIGAVDEE